MRLLILSLLLLPLSGCFEDGSATTPFAGEAVYESADGTLHLRLDGPVHVLMGDGSYQEANLLEAWFEGSPDGVTSMALDGDLRSLWRYDDCIYFGVSGCESPARVDWIAHGRLGLFGVGWMQTGHWQRVEYEDVAAAIVQDGNTLTVRPEPGLPRASLLGLQEGRYEYADLGLFPTRMVLGQNVFERISWTPSGPLASVPVYEPDVPSMGADVLYPATDEPVFAKEALNPYFAALLEDPAPASALSVGCLRGVDYPFWQEPQQRGLLQTEESEAFTFHIGGPQSSAWRVTRYWNDVTPERFEVRQTAPASSLGDCRPRPLATISAQEFLDAAAPFRASSTSTAKLSFATSPTWLQDSESVPVVWSYREWGASGVAVALELDAHTGSWRSWQIPVEQVTQAGLVQAAMAADSSSRNQ